MVNINVNCEDINVHFNMLDQIIAVFHDIVFVAIYALLLRKIFRPKILAAQNKSLLESLILPYDEPFF